MSHLGSSSSDYVQSSSGDYVQRKAFNIQQRTTYQRTTYVPTYNVHRTTKKHTDAHNNVRNICDITVDLK
jgi:hypothetical protein